MSLTPPSILQRMAALARREHYHCEDSWYQCPAHPEGSADWSKPTGVCDCGADAHNAKVDALLAEAGMSTT